MADAFDEKTLKIGEDHSKRLKKREDREKGISGDSVATTPDSADELVEPHEADCAEEEVVEETTGPLEVSEAVSSQLTSRGRICAKANNS